MQNTVYDCPNGCCQLIYWKRVPEEINTQYPDIKNRYKAGVIMESDDKVLIVQSRGHMWGFPKGSLEYGETTIKGAERELREETGISLKIPADSQIFKIYHTTYFTIKMRKPICISKIKSIHNNDSTGVGWISLSCIKKALELDDLLVNSHLKQYLKRKTQHKKLQTPSGPGLLDGNIDDLIKIFDSVELSD
jgi:ADP-ribose pyrophosphatase YjhB (NUDIX family)